MTETQTSSVAEDEGEFSPASRLRIVQRVLAGTVIVLLLLAGAAVGVRLIASTDAGRGAVERLLNGQSLGAVGHLHIEGLRGDPFGDFSVREIEIDDAQGPWLIAHDLNVAWRPIELLARRAHLAHLRVGLLQVLRSPKLTIQPKAPPAKMPISVALDDAKLRLETSPAFSVQRGLWDVVAKADLRRSGHLRATVTAKSLLHAGDGLALALQIGRRDRFLLRADAVEARHGALAGALGLPADQDLNIHAAGDGTSAAGAAHMKASLGQTTPFQADIRWGAVGASVQARASLTTSRLTQFLANRLGPEAKIDLRASSAKSGLYQVIGEAVARDGSISVSGPLDWSRRVTPGIAVTATVADLSKWTETPKLGQVRLRGSLAGAIGDFQFKGDLAGDHLNQNGYALARVFGPITISLKDREWRFKANLAGVQGGGKGLLASLLGTAPHVQLDISKLKDGHFLFRTLNVQGAGLLITAQGGQGLFGQLAFKGGAQIADLARLRSGAKGRLTATWDASESRSGKGWSFAFNSKGDGFVSGLADLDHFLGSSPSLAAKGVVSAAGLSITEAKLSGASLQASGKGDLGAHQELQIAFDWTAKGPIVVGPLEVGGTAKGVGKISGTLSAPRADLIADLSSLDFGQLVVTPAKLTISLLQGPDGLTGEASLAGPTTKYGPANAKAAFRFVGDGVNLSDIVADAGGVKLAGGVMLHGGEPSSADLTFVAVPGAFLSSGRLNGKVKIVDRPGGAVADIALNGADVQGMGAPTTFHTLALRAEGPLKQLPFQLSLDSQSPIAWGFAGAGILNHSPAENQISLQGQGRIRKANFKFTEPALIRIGGANASAHVKLAIAGGQAVVDAEQLGDALNAKASVSDVGLAAFSEDFVGTASGGLVLQGRGAHLSGALNAALTGARSRDAPADEGLTTNVKATLADTRVHIDAVATNAAGLKSDGMIDLPAEASAAPFRIAIDRTKPVQGTFSADGEVRPLWDLFAGGERTLSGHVATSGTVQGSLNDFKASGQGTLTNGKFRDVGTGLALQSLDVDTTFGRDGVTVRRFSGADVRGGTVTGDGQVSFAEDGASTFTLNLKHFQLIDNDIGRATASGAVTVTHPAKGQGKLSGKLTIDRADIVAATPTPTGVVPMDVVEIHQAYREGRRNLRLVHWDRRSLWMCRSRRIAASM